MSYGYPSAKWNLSASSAPGVSDDRPHGYEPLSLWLKQDSSGIYICTSNAPGAAAWQLIGSSSTTGTVTSVGLSLPAELTISNSPVTTTGTLTGVWANQTQNKVFASPSGSTGTPAFRALVAGDIPNIAESQVTNLTTDLGNKAAKGVNTDITQLNGASQVDVSSVYKIGGVQVMAARDTGWTAPTGTPSKAGYATSTATLTQVAETLKALIDALFTQGEIGA